ncbi:MAG: PQQ-binding-like beta-propeller repeat protein [Anaerolineae bacterium]|nr:PQQ-binding-like beta-propeller repeat protein [Anaerolineae bacterium]
MKKNWYQLLSLLLLGAVLLASCSGSALSAGQSWPNVAADPESGVVYLTAGSILYAVDAESGSLVWTAPEKPNARVSFYAPALVVEDQVIVGDFKSSIHSYNASDGGENWVFEGARDKFIGGATFGNDLLFAPSADYSVYALDLNGDLAFKMKTEQVNWSTPVLDETHVYVTSMDHFLYAFDINTGELEWKTDLLGAVSGSPALLDGVLYVGTLNREVLAVSTGDGEIIWTASVNDYVWSTPEVWDGMLFIGDAAGTVYALDSENGDQVWSASTGSPITARLTTLGDLLVAVTRDRDVIAFNPVDGSKEWTRSISDATGSLHSNPVVVGDLIIIPLTQGSDQLMAAYDANGNAVWNFLPEK